MKAPSRPYDFSSPDADAILASSDGAELRVHRCILVAASPVFRDMFSMPQSTKGAATVSVISCSEDRRTLETTLLFVYPCPDPHIESLDDAVPLLEVAIKYEFAAVISALRRALVHPEFLKVASLRVFAIACRYDLEDEARIASSHTLRINILDTAPTSDLKHISAYSYHLLLTLHKNRSVSAISLLKPPPSLQCPQCNSPASGHARYNFPKWWTEFAKRAREELGVRPTTDVVFGLEFLAKVASDCGCAGCPGSLLESAEYLESVRRGIDALPNTV